MAERGHEVGLIVEGRQYSGWTEVAISRSMDAIAGTFTLSVSNRWDTSPSLPRQIYPEDVAQVTVDDQLVIAGYVDGRGVSLGSDEHTLSIAGRDRTAALIDNCVAAGPYQFDNMGLLEICRHIADPFDVHVFLQDGLDTATFSSSGKRGSARTSGLRSVGAGGPARRAATPARRGIFPRFAINPGETAFEALERACRFAGLVPVSDGNGAVILSHATAQHSGTSLVERVNVIAAEMRLDASKKFHRYIVRGQSHGTDDASGTVAAAVSGEARDETVRRKSRVLVLHPEGSVSRQQARDRAQWEATVRAARWATVSVTVWGWYMSNGLLWSINTMVGMKSDRLGVDGDMLVTAVTFRQSSSGGTVTELELAQPEAYFPEPVITKKKHRGGITTEP